MHRFLFMLFLVGVAFHVVSGYTDPQDATVIRSLKDAWQNLPPSWLNSDDPCGDQWVGITCNNSWVVSMRLSAMGVNGSLSGDIGGLDELRTLDLSYNSNLTGPLTPTIGKLKNLNTLILSGCSFTGSIPEELGNLSQLTHLALNSNNFTGKIPSSLGKLSKLYWLDLAENQLTGSLPVSPGLDQLFNAKHFHLNKNRLSGLIPRRLFSSSMVLIHILFDGNNFTGSIPDTLGLVQSLEVLRLDRNNFVGPIPESINNLTNLIELHLAGNRLTGNIPDLSGLSSLNYIDLSDNSFEPSDAPDWLSTLQTLTTLVMEIAQLTGSVPTAIFSLPQLQQVKLGNNSFNGTLDLGQTISSQLQLVDLKFNNISSVTLGSGYTNALELFGNPVCSQLSNFSYCEPQLPSNDSYTTSSAKCGKKQCSTDREILNPQSCDCAYPYEGTLFFRAPQFTDLSNSTMFQSLEKSLWTELLLNPGFVFLQNIFFNSDDYLQMRVALFPSVGKHFNGSEIQRLGFDLSNQTYKSPPEFGPYYFIASPY